MNGNPTWTWISSSDAKTLSATVAFLIASPRNQTDRKYPICLPESNKSKKTLAIHAGSRGRLIGGLSRFLWPFLKSGASQTLEVVWPCMQVDQ